MVQANVIAPKKKKSDQKLAFVLFAIFITQFVSFLFINARNIAQPVMLADLDGLSLFSLLIALPALGGSVGTLLFGKLSDMYGRRAILLISLGIFLVGLVLSAASPTMPTLIAAQTFMSMGHFPIIPLCFSVIGDLFSPSERAKWTGLLNIPTLIAAAIGPTLGGYIAETSLGWRAIFWGTVPLVLIASALIVVGISGRTQQIRQKVDILGTGVMVIATASLIFGVTLLAYPDWIWLGVVLLVVSGAAWVGFIRVEQSAEAPILDPQVLFNRTFATAAFSGLLSFFGTVAIMAYAPIFAQDVMQVDPSISGSMLTPFTVIVALMGIAAGFLLSRTKKAKWIYNVSYTLVAIALLIMWRFTADTPIWIYVLVTAVAGIGLGAIPVINTLVAQFAVPRRLLGVAVGAVFFFQIIGIAVAPALLGLAQNAAPDLENGLKAIFLVAGLMMVVGLLLVLTIPEVAMDVEVPDKVKV